MQLFYITLHYITLPLVYGAKVDSLTMTRTILPLEEEQEGLAVASIARDVVVEMTPPSDDNSR